MILEEEELSDNDELDYLQGLHELQAVVDISDEALAHRYDSPLMAPEPADSDAILDEEDGAEMMAVPPTAVMQDSILADDQDVVMDEEDTSNLSGNQQQNHAGAAMQPAVSIIPFAVQPTTTPLQSTVDIPTLYLNPVLSDLTLIAQGERLPAHKLLVCLAIPALRDIIQQLPLSSNEVELPDSCSAATAKAMLRYIYCSSIPEQQMKAQAIRWPTASRCLICSSMCKHTAWTC